MPDTPQQRVRMSIAVTVVDELAERLLQHDKANQAYKLRHLRSDDERKVYRDAILAFLADPTGRLLRVNKVNQLRGHDHAIADDEAESIARQARRDIEMYAAGVANFGQVKPGHCWFCKTRITPEDAFFMEITATLKVDVHGSCASNDPRCEMVTAFSFRWKGGAR